MGVDSIPEGEDTKKWIKLKVPQSNSFLFLEVPDGENTSSYRSEMNNKLNSGNNPIAGAIINKVRVVHKDELENKN
jgi:hypothetical protein